MERTVETSSRMALEVPLISARYARQFIRFMERKGVRRQAILGETDISSEMLDDPDASLSMGQVRQLLGKAEWLMGDDRAAFQFGQQLDLPAHGLLGFAVLGQENPRRLISMIVQYLRVGLPLMDMDLSSTGSTFRIQLIDTWGLGDLRPCLTKIYMGSIHRISSQVCTHFCFEFDFDSSLEPEQWRSIAADCEFRFNAPASQVTMPLSGRPIRNDETGLEFILANARSREREPSEQADETVMQVREMIMSQPGRPCTMDNLARRLDISPRTLRQHLSTAGTSFRELRNEIRQNFATLYLTDTAIPLDSIAEKLGFSDQAGFTKAYRSWTGHTPGDVRRQSRDRK